jgi:putative transcriptional regulator
MQPELNSVRRQLGFTQEELARLTGLSLLYVNIKNGGKNPSIVSAFRIAHVLKKPMEKLFGNLIATERG